ncbi:phage repressor protein C with HTH and peptisase S24 domain [Marinobacterium sp. MBR-111]|jgi:phage repressor protein C with HTH and peptisase S24 domain|uniref:S24 family peptidase n=1 Tax=Marinobacterium sp. MBR-111 TaxID=3156463 RepID=UPI0033907E8F
MDKREIRRQNMKALLAHLYNGERGAQARFASIVGKQPDYISRCIADPSKKGSKTIGEDFAELIENTFGFERYSFSSESFDPAAANTHKSLIKQNVTYLMEKAGITSFTQAAERAKLNQATLHRILEGESRYPRIENLQKIADLFGISEPTDLLKKDLSKEHLSNQGNVISADFTPKGRLSDEEITIPQFDVRAAMGPGQVASDYVETVRHLTLHKQYLKNQGLRYSGAKHLAVITGWGQSMEGTINDGDPVIIDRGVQTFIGDGVYLLTWNDMLYIKRLQMASADTFKMISDNPSHENQEVNAADITIQAKVLMVWNARKL